MGQTGSKDVGRESERLVAAGPSEQLRQLVRCLAAVLVGLGFYAMLSAGLCVVSSCLVVAQGFLWLADSADAAAFSRAVAVLRRPGRGADACCACHVRHFGVAVAGIVMGALEAIVLVSTLGAIGGVNVTSISFIDFNCSPIYCPSYNYNTYYCNPAEAATPFFTFSVWALYAAGHAAVAAPLNITLSVLSLQLCRLLFDGNDVSGSGYGAGAGSSSGGRYGGNDGIGGGVGLGSGSGAGGQYRDGDQRRPELVVVEGRPLSST